MYDVKRMDENVLLDYENKGYNQTIFTTYDWLQFLKKDQRIEIVVLSLSFRDECVALFVAGLITKYGLKILGSPFEGWLTCDMGFLKIKEINIDEALMSVKKYAFSILKCHYIQITDKGIGNVDSRKYLTETTKLLKIDNSKSLDCILDNFTKNGRRDVRASSRKGLDFFKVEFDKHFVDSYYEQLEDVFAKQKLKPFYGLDKLYNLVEVFKNHPERVCALEARLNEKCVATVFSIASENWAYYMGAASFREYQKYLPNEGLFWEFIKYWHESGIKNVDLVGYREYKLKYNPTVIDMPVIIFQKYPFIHFLKKVAYKIVVLKRKIEGKKK